jgi:hypothetical protein
VEKILSKSWFAAARSFTSPAWPTAWATTSMSEGIHSGCDSQQWDGGQQPAIGDGGTEGNQTLASLSRWGIKPVVCNCSAGLIKTATASGAKCLHYHQCHLQMLSTKSSLVIQWSCFISLFCLSHE